MHGDSESDSEGDSAGEEPARTVGSGKGGGDKKLLSDVAQALKNLGEVHLHDVPLADLPMAMGSSALTTPPLESSPDALFGSLLSNPSILGSVNSSSSSSGTGSLPQTDAGIAASIFSQAFASSVAGTISSMPPSFSTNAQPSAAPSISEFMDVGLACGGFDERMRAAALGIDLDAVLAIFYKWFYRFMPVFTEEELRMYISLNEAPDHVIYSVAAICATYTTFPRTRPYYYDAAPSQAEYFTRKAQETLTPRLEKLVAPSIFEAYSALLLCMQFMFRGIRIAGGSYLQTALQIMQTMLSPPPNMLQPPAPPRRQISIMFWTLWGLDRKGVLFSNERTSVMNFESYATIPDLPDMPTSLQSPFNASMVFAAYIRIMTLICRVVLWFRDSVKNKSVQNARMRSIYLLPQETAETVQTLIADLSDFTSPSSFPPPYLIIDPDIDLQPYIAKMTDLEVHFWVMTNLMYRLCTLYFDMDARRKWHTVELIAKITTQLSLPTSSFVVRIASETASDLIQSGYILLSSPAATSAPPASGASSTVARWTTYPTLEEVLSWYDAVIESKADCFWWVRDDLYKLKAVVNNWRQLLYQQVASTVFDQFDGAATTATTATTSPADSSFAAAAAAVFADFTPSSSSSSSSSSAPPSDLASPPLYPWQQQQPSPPVSS
ncbi:hypothetical protein RI367_000109 [Sorochytrium milnesiophthora]